MTRTDLLQLCQRLGLTPIPLKPCSKEPLVRWGDVCRFVKEWQANPATPGWGIANHGRGGQGHFVGNCKAGVGR